MPDNSTDEEHAVNSAAGDALAALSFTTQGTHYFSASDGGESLGELASFEETCLVDPKSISIHLHNRLDKGGRDHFSDDECDSSSEFDCFVAPTIPRATVTAENLRHLTTKAVPAPSIDGTVDSTPPMRNSRKEYRLQGVHINSVLADFLGVSFLPFDDRLTRPKKVSKRGQLKGLKSGGLTPTMDSSRLSKENTAITAPAPCPTPAGYVVASKHTPGHPIECDEMTFESCVEHHDDLGLVLSAQKMHPVSPASFITKSIENEVGYSLRPSRKKRKNKKVGRALKSLRKKISQKHRQTDNGSSSGARELSVDRSSTITNASGTLVKEIRLLDTEATVSDCMALISSNEEKIAEMRSELDGITEDSKSALKEVECISRRVQDIVKNVADLEERLSASRQELELEKIKLTKKAREVRDLDHKLVGAFNSIERSSDPRSRDVEHLPRPQSRLPITDGQHRNPDGRGENKESSETRADSITKRSDDELSAEHSGLLQGAKLADVERVERKEPTKSIHRASSFIRTHDLQFDLPGAESGTNATPDLHDISNSEHTDTIFDQLAKVGYDCATDEGPRWTALKETGRILANRDTSSWNHAEGNEILVWHGFFDHGGYGSDLPAVKARGNINTSARNLLDLLLDSTRVKEYNKMSQGRTDEFYFQKGIDSGPAKGEAKIIRSLNKPPMIKPIEMLSLLHAKKLDTDTEVQGYLVVSRSVWETCDVPPSKPTTTSSGGVTRSEMLLGVNLIRSVDASSCEFTTVTHVSSSNVPMMIAKKVGLTAASNFIRDIQAIYA